MAARRTYVRPMQGWWRRDPYFLRYMAREMTAPFVALYALLLLVGLVSLARGRAPFEAWIGAMRSPFALVLHVALIGIFAYHTVTWFGIMPKTMPPLIVGGRKLGAGLITLAGLAVAALCMAALWILAGAFA